jgi:hypothetical protein
MSLAVSTKNTSWFCRMKSWVRSAGLPISLAPATPNSLMPMPTVVLRSGRDGTVSLEMRSHAGYSFACAKTPTRSSGGRSGRTTNRARAMPCGLRKTGRRAGACPRASRGPIVMSTNICLSEPIGSVPQSSGAAAPSFVSSAAMAASLTSSLRVMKEVQPAPAGARRSRGRCAHAHRAGRW